MRISATPTQLAIYVLAASALVPATSAQAALLASESFLIGSNPAAGQYDASLATGLRTQSPIVSGFTGEWTDINFDVVPAITPTNLFKLQSTGLDFGPASHETGGSVQLLNSFDGGRKALFRSLVPHTPASGDALYFSGILSSSESSALNTGESLISFVDTSTSGFGISFGFVGGNVVAKYRASSESTATRILQTGFEANTPYYFVLKLEINVGTGTEAFQDRLTVWLNPVGLGSDAAAGTPTLEAMTAALSTNPLDHVTLTTTGVQDVGINFDEIRFGTSFSDVAPVPEPSTFGLGVAAMAGLLGFGRRRKA